MPDKIVKPVGARFGYRFIDAALLVTRSKPGRDNRADARAREIEHLQACAPGQTFRKELAQDFTRAFVRADERGYFERKTFRMGVAIKPSAFIEDAVG